MGKLEIELLGQAIHRLRRTGMGDTLLRNILASSWPGEWGIFNRTLIKAAHLPHGSVGGGDPPLFLPLPRLPCPELVEVGGIALANARAPDIASVGGACCNEYDVACLGPCLRFIGADQTPGCGVAAGPPRARASSPFLLPPPSLFWLEGSSFAGSLSFSFSFRLRAPACFLSRWADFSALRASNKGV